MARQLANKLDKIMFVIVLPLLALIGEIIIFYLSGGIIRSWVFEGVKFIFMFITSLLLYIICLFSKIKKLVAYSVIPPAAYYGGGFLLAFIVGVIYPLIGLQERIYATNFSITGLLLVFVIFGLIPYVILRYIGKDEEDRSI